MNKIKQTTVPEHVILSGSSFHIFSLLKNHLNRYHGHSPSLTNNIFEMVLGGYRAKLEEFFLENLIYFSCELIICLAVSQPRMVRIPQSSIAQIHS